MSDIVTLRECIVSDNSTLAIIAAATLLEAFAGLVPGHALLAHCRENHLAAVYTSMLEQPQTRAWLAEVPLGAAPVGYAILTAPDFPPGLVRDADLELRRIYLFSRFHGTGTGQRMMDIAITTARQQQAKHLLLGVNPKNQRAIAFYRKNGFVQVGTRKFRVGSEFFQDPVFCLDL